MASFLFIFVISANYSCGTVKPRLYKTVVSIDKDDKPQSTVGRGLVIIGMRES